MKKVMYKGFHTKTFELIDHLPEISKENLAALDRLENRLGFALPTSFREWMQFEGVVDILREYSNTDQIASVQAMLGEEPRFPSTTLDELSDYYKANKLTFLIENQGVCHWAIELNEEEYPPVYVFDETLKDPWLLSMKHFSDFIYFWVWDFLGWRGRSYLAELIYKPTDERTFEFLTQLFTELPPNRMWFTANTYRFERNQQAIRIMEFSGQADWQFRAETEEQFLEFIDIFDELFEDIRGKKWFEHLMAYNDRTKELLSSLS